MRRLVYLSAARRDLVDILRYIARESGSPDVARRFTTSLREQCTRLASLPGELGTPRPELRQDIRSFPHRGYVIFFRYTADRLEVVTIMEGHRDIEGWFAARNA
jgi:toxin ParE1/3/4